MKFRVLIFTLTLFFPPSLLARDSTDVVVMKNGDRLTCEVRALSAGVLSIKLKYVQGTIGVQWSEVARLESDQLFLVKTEGGTVYTGKLSTTARPGERAVSIEVATAPEKVNKDPHGSWMLKMKLKNPGELGDLLSAEAYEQFVAEEGGH